MKNNKQKKHKSYVVSRSIEKSTTAEKTWIMDNSVYINESSEVY